ncbi:MAG: deaminase [Gemmatimonadales bacterium]
MIKGMRAALEQARLAATKDEVPIGAVVMRGESFVAEAHNETVARRNPT